MKKTIFIIIYFSLIQADNIVAQVNNTNIKSGKIGITYSSFGENQVIRFQEWEGEASYNCKSFYNIGMTYIHPVNSWLEIETGLDYSRHTIKIVPDVLLNINYSTLNESFSFISVPATLRANFLKYCFVNAGLFIDVDASFNGLIDNQTGIGAIAGIALKYDFKFGISAFVNPYIKMHSIVPFSLNNNHQRILESAVRIGLTYDLGKKK